MQSVRALMVLLALSFCTVVCQAQLPPKPMTDFDVIRLVNAGYGDEVIIKQIHTAQTTNFRLDTMWLRRLKRVDVSDAVIQAMAARGASAPVPGPSPGASSALPLAASVAQPTPPPPPAPIVAEVYVAGTKGALKQAITAQYVLAQPTDDRNDLTAAGAVIDLLKDNLVLGTTAQVATDSDGKPIHVAEPMSSYKNGKFEKGGFTKWTTFIADTSFHKMVAGEKFWLIGVEIRDDGAVLEFLSDPINGVRFKGFVKYPFPKGQMPAADLVLQQIGETVKAEPMQTELKQQITQSAPAGQSTGPAPEAPPPPIAPPPPPPADPKTIELGLTREQVISSLGQPEKIVKLPTKQIYIYKDMKITFVGGKVTDIQ